MNKTYDEIISVVRRDINNLEKVIITGDDFFSEAVLKSLILAPAKRIRSVIAFLFLRAYGLEISEKQLNLQCAVERHAAAGRRRQTDGARPSGGHCRVRHSFFRFKAF